MHFSSRTAHFPLIPGTRPPTPNFLSFIYFRESVQRGLRAQSNVLADDTGKNFLFSFLFFLTLLFNCLLAHQSSFLLCSFVHTLISLSCPQLLSPLQFSWFYSEFRTNGLNEATGAPSKPHSSYQELANSSSHRSKWERQGRLDSFRVWFAVE